VERIKKRQDLVLAYLISASAQHLVLQAAGFEIAHSDAAGGVAIIKSPVGNGRVKYGWRIDGGALLGTISFERETQDQYGRLYWEPVWGLNVPEYDNPYSGASEGGVVIPIDDNYGNYRTQALNDVILSVLYGIVSGPVHRGE
jgi:hypothetical protein